MKKILFGIFATVAFVFVAVPAYAKPMPKVDICHYDADMQTYHKINVSENAKKAHMDHGDGLPGDNISADYKLGADCSKESRWILRNILTVNSQDLGGEDSMLLQTGEVYKFEASGTYSFASWAGDPIADAKYSYRGTADPLGLNNQWVDGAALPNPYQNYLQLWVNGGPVTWNGSLDLVNHTYTYNYIGANAPVNFMIQDGGAIGDNSGSLTVKIYSY